MSFPNVVYGGVGDQFVTGSTQTVDPLGTQMIFADGRKFRYVQKSSAAAVAGDVQAGQAIVGNHTAQTPVAAAVGALSVNTALGASTTADQYRDGYLVVELGTGFGYAYQIATHGVIATAGAVPLREPVQVAIPATAASISLIPSSWRGTVASPVTPLQRSTGVAMKPIAASGYGWLQSRGICGATVVANTVVGNNLTIITTAGSLGPLASAVSPIIAVASNTVVAATNKGTVDVVLDG